MSDNEDNNEGVVIDAKDRFGDAEEANSEANPLTALRESNAAALQGLAQQGAHPPLAVMLKLRVDVLIDLFVPAAFRDYFELMFENAMSEYLQHVGSEVNKARLLEGVKGPMPPRPGDAA